MKHDTNKTNFHPLHPDPARSSTLPGHYYSDPAIFEAEKQRIFYRHWQLGAHVSDLPQPGNYVCIQVVDQEIFLIRGKDGIIRGFYNVCQHRAHELLRGCGRLRSTIVCPYHAWTYGIDGKLRSARSTAALPDFDKADYGLSPVRVEEIMGFVFVNLDPEASSLESQAGDMFDDIRAQLPWRDEVSVTSDAGQGWTITPLEANWKVLGENCLECYHCAPAHPAFVDLVDLSDYVCQLRGSWLKSHGRLKKADNKAYRVDPDDPVQVMSYWHLWPNIEFGVIPGEASLIAFHFSPVTPDTTRIVSVMLNRPGETVGKERLEYRNKVLWPEDESICRSVHRGLKSRGYRQGRFVIDPEAMGISEHAVHYFQLRYAEAMGLVNTVDKGKK